MDSRVIPKTVKIALAAPGANTAILSTALTPTLYSSVFRVGVRLATASVFNVTITPTGGAKILLKLNDAAALTAGAMKTFYVPVRKHDGAATPVANAYNFEVETDGVISYLQVDEMEHE